MTRFRLLALLFEIISMVSLQQKLFALVNESAGLPPIQNETAVSEALHCLENRGTNGRWVRNPTDQSAAEASAWTTRWRWREDSGCFVSTRETQQDWCTLMTDLNITRVLTAGDSTMHSFAKSFRTALLDNSTLKLATSLEENSELPCGLQHKHIALSRYPLHLDREPSLLSDTESGRILVVVSLGVPTKRVLDFHANLVNLLEWIDEWRQPNDLIFYRSSVPASTSSRAPGPWPYNIATNSETSRVESYNEHANGFLPELKIRYLNVFNSALLPPSEVNFGTSYPSGIFDVWVHMMYSSLLDVRTLEEQPSSISLAIQ